MKRGVLALVCAALLAPALPVSADEGGEGEKIYPIVFPVVGEHYFTDDYDAPRSGGTRTHRATDIMADKMTPVVAAVDGEVTWVSHGTYTDCTGATTPSFSLGIRHDDGYRSRYIHLNNDTPGTDDGQGTGYARGIEEGVRVAAGQLIGWVGDSGNAECTPPHLHFELFTSDSSRFNPYESLLAATHLNPVDSDEIFFYRGDGVFRYYDINSNATLGTPLASGDNYTRDWSTITAIELDGDGSDEVFFYRDDGLFRYYDIRPDGTIPKPMTAGSNYTRGWDSITAVDLDGDGQDEMFFYRDDGLYRYYDIRSDGKIPKPMQAGDEYTSGWDAIVAVDLDGDGQDEMFFYRADGLYRFYEVRPDGKIGTPISSGNDFPDNWTAIAAIDLNGDHHDEMLFYRDNGEFAFHPVTSDGVLGEPILSGNDYTTGWNSITAIDLDG